MTTWTLILFFNLSLYGYNNAPPMAPNFIHGLVSEASCKDAGQRITDTLQPFNDGYFNVMKFNCVEVSNSSGLVLKNRGR